MSFKERVVFLDRAALTPDDLPIPNFEHNWSEYPETEPADLVPRLFGSPPRLLIPRQLTPRLSVNYTNSPASSSPGLRWSVALRARQMNRVQHLPTGGTPEQALIELLEALVDAGKH